MRATPPNVKGIGRTTRRRPSARPSADEVALTGRLTRRKRPRHHRGVSIRHKRTRLPAGWLGPNTMRPLPAGIAGLPREARSPRKRPRLRDTRFPPFCFAVPLNPNGPPPPALLPSAKSKPPANASVLAVQAKSKRPRTAALQNRSGVLQTPPASILTAGRERGTVPPPQPGPLSTRSFLCRGKSTL